MKLLFISHQNKKRSKHVEELFRHEYKTQSAGLYNNEPVTSEQLHWADLVFVMKDSHKQELERRFSQVLAQKKVVNLNIPSYFNKNEPNMVEELKSKVLKHI